MKLIRSFGFALKGIKVAFREELNIRIHVLALIITIGAGIYFKITPIEWCFIFLASGFVFSLELINTAIENLTDLVAPEKNSMAEKIKDVAAAAVLVSSIAALLTGVIIFAKYL